MLSRSLLKTEQSNSPFPMPTDPVEMAKHYDVNACA
jgi:hypothetical protein